MNDEMGYIIERKEGKFFFLTIKLSRSLNWRTKVWRANVVGDQLEMTCITKTDNEAQLRASALEEIKQRRLDIAALNQDIERAINDGGIDAETANANITLWLAVVSNHLQEIRKLSHMLHQVRFVQHTTTVQFTPYVWYEAASQMYMWIPHTVPNELRETCVTESSVTVTL